MWQEWGGGVDGHFADLAAVRLSSANV